MSRVLALRNRQRTRRVDVRLFRRVAEWALREQFHATDYELGLHLVGADEMARVNQTFLGHEGSTDVITFDHSNAAQLPQPQQRGDSLSPARSGGEGRGEGVLRFKSQGSCLNRRPSSPQPSPPSEGGEGAGRARLETIHGEIFICLDDALKQAREFGTTWQSELTRYLLHGLLHLHGFDDLAPAARRRMKREENRLLRLAARQFPLHKLARKAT